VADIAAFSGIAMAWSSRYGGQPHPFVCVQSPQPMPAPGAALISPISGFREWSGRSLALAVARYLVMFLKRPGGQAQFSTILALQGAEDRFGALHSWMAGRLTDDLSLPALARKVG
jgi:hypothetical protein